jgi:integrative and conjugative element protein (TIGR02256 family)
VFLRRKPSGIAWIEKDALSILEEETERTCPLETGGVLIGYWVRQVHEVVIIKSIGPGPKATHTPKSFVPDYEWQEKEIARIYTESGRYYTYLGDWHSHPKGSGMLSIKDQFALWHIAGSVQARAPVRIPTISLLLSTYCENLPSLPDHLLW